MIGINATTPPLFSSYARTLTEERTQHLANNPHLDQSIWRDMAWSDFSKAAARLSPDISILIKNQTEKAANGVAQHAS